MVGMASLVGMAGAVVLANAGRHAAWLQALAEGEEGEVNRVQAPAPTQPPPAPKPPRAGTGSLPGGSLTPSGAVAAAVALALSNARRMGEAWGAARALEVEALSLVDRSARGTRWKTHELEVVVRAVRTLPPRLTPTDTDRLLKELGWPSDSRTRLRLQFKLATLRYRISHGGTPEEVLQARKRTPDRSLTYRAWAIKALAALPGGQGTVEEMGAVLLTDPSVEPKLDKRPNVELKAVAQWRKSLMRTLGTGRGFINTGLKRDGMAVYGFDPVAAAGARDASALGLAQLRAAQGGGGGGGGESGRGSSGDGSGSGDSSGRTPAAYFCQAVACLLEWCYAKGRGEHGPPTATVAELSTPGPGEDSGPLAAAEAAAAVVAAPLPPLLAPPAAGRALTQLLVCGGPGCDSFGGRSEAELPLKRCGGCKAVRYCGSACQRAHWRLGHRAECGAMGAPALMRAGGVK